jgi:hypothetical protein
MSFFQVKTSKSSIYFNFIVHLNLEEVHFRSSVAMSYRTGQHRSRESIGRERKRGRGRVTAVWEP